MIRERARVRTPDRWLLRMMGVRLPDGRVGAGRRCCDRDDDDSERLQGRGAFTEQPTDAALQMRLLRIFPEQRDRDFEWATDALEAPPPQA